MVDEHHLPNLLRSRVLEIRPHYRPCVRLTPNEGGEARRSRFGGAPDLPLNFAWPLDREGVPLNFLCQIDFEEVDQLLREGSAGLPSRGLFQFFYAADNGEEWHYAFHAPQVHLAPAEGPALPQIAVPMNFILGQSLPEWIPGVMSEWSIEESDAYDEYRKSFITKQGEAHQIGGHPDAIQDDPTEAGSFGNPNGNRRLLLQIDSDDRIGYMWGDVGMLYVLANSEALQREVLKDVQVVEQCY